MSCGELFHPPPPFWTDEEGTDESRGGKGKVWSEETNDGAGVCHIISGFPFLWVIVGGGEMGTKMEIWGGRRGGRGPPKWFLGGLGLPGRWHRESGSPTLRIMLVLVVAKQSKLALTPFGRQISSSSSAPYILCSSSGKYSIVVVVLRSAGSNNACADVVAVALRVSAQRLFTLVPLLILLLIIIVGVEKKKARKRDC